ncbi:hypothetical protein Goklo_007348 [Gossypium klotzschianum]|uniref:Uncharacterized protein n=1 Tax=Gossypium klotzschianum TaxID=34286 RepID=A0A7J8WAS3_9ROSI|nr:hypothetical protein [Gossypium klotzschianum]
MGSNLHWIWDSQTSFLRVIQSWLFRTYNKQKEMGQPAMAVEGLRADEDSFWVEDAPLKVLEVADSDRQFSRPP